VAQFSGATRKPQKQLSVPAGVAEKRVLGNAEGDPG